MRFGLRLWLRFGLRLWLSFGLRLWLRFGLRLWLRLGLRFGLRFRLSLGLRVTRSCGSGRGFARSSAGVLNRGLSRGFAGRGLRAVRFAIGVFGDRCVVLRRRLRVLREVEDPGACDEQPNDDNADGQEFAHAGGCNLGDRQVGRVDKRCAVVAPETHLHMAELQLVPAV